MKFTFKNSTLQQRSRLFQLAKLLYCEEIIIDTVHFTFPQFSSGAWKKLSPSYIQGSNITTVSMETVKKSRSVQPGRPN